MTSVLSRHCKGFFDVGANCGYFTYYFSIHTKNKVPIFFFEPNPRLFSDISRGVSKNKMSSVQGFKMALGSETGKSKFYLDLTDDFSSSLTTEFQAGHEVQEITVESSTFSDFVSARRLEGLLVKVDVEGAEFDFITGAIPAKDSVEYLIIEVLLTAHKKNFIQWAKKQMGMEAYYIKDYTLQYSKGVGFDYSVPDYNWLFCRFTPTELAKKIEGGPFKVEE